jgi:hypothetical protein
MKTWNTGAALLSGSAALCALDKGIQESSLPLARDIMDVLYVVLQVQDAESIFTQSHDENAASFLTAFLTVFCRPFILDHLGQYVSL